MNKDASDRNELIAALLPQIKAWRDDNPDTTGIYPQVDLDTMEVVGTQDGNSSWDGSSSDPSDWHILDLFGEIGEIAVYGREED